MKKTIFLTFALLFTFIMKAQLVLTAQSNGVVDVEYGPDFSLFDPQGATEVYIYMWVDPGQTNPALSQQYNDDWNNASSLVTITYNNSTGKFEGQIDFNTHNFPGEGVIPAGTQINDFNLILRNQAGDRQTGNLLASSYGFTQTLSSNLRDIFRGVRLINGNLMLDSSVLNLAPVVIFYDLSGKKYFQIRPRTNTAKISLPHGVYVMQIWVSGKSVAKLIVN